MKAGLDVNRKMKTVINFLRPPADQDRLASEPVVDQFMPGKDERRVSQGGADDK